jgi:hypothetical protein
MPVVAWFTVIIAALIIALTAVALLRVIFHLKYVRDRLSTVAVAAQDIADKTSTVPTVLPSVNEHLKPVRDFCESV